MEKVITVLLVFSIGLGTQLRAQGKTYSKKSVKKEIMLPDFDKIEVYGLAQVYLSEGSKPYARLEVSGMPMDEVIVKVENRTLKISTPGNYSGESVKIYITYKEVNKLLVTDAAEIFSETPIRTSTLEISALDAGNAVLEINVNLVKIRMADSADLTLTGHAKKQKILSNSKSGTFTNSGLLIDDH